MGIVNEIKELYETFKNDKNMMLAIKIIIWGFIAVCIINIGIYFVDRSNNRHAKMLWGMSEYFPDDSKKDSFANNYPEVIHDTTTKYDTFINYKINKPLKKYGSSMKLSTEKKDLSTSKNSQKIDSGSSGIQNNNSTVFGNQAGRDINNYGIIPRKITRDFLTPLFNLRLNKNRKIIFTVYDGADAEITDVRNQIVTLFKNEGYNNIDPSFHLKVGFVPPDNISIDTGNNFINVNIPPAKK